MPMRGTSWECPKVIEHGHPAIHKSNKFCAEYSRCKGDPKSRTLFWRGLVSEQDTTPTGPILDTIETLGPIEECTESKVTIFTDGQGGKEPKTKDCANVVGHGSYRDQVLTKMLYMGQEVRWEARRQYQGPNSGPYTIASKA